MHDEYLREIKVGLDHFKVSNHKLYEKEERRLQEIVEGLRYEKQREARRLEK